MKTFTHTSDALYTRHNYKLHHDLGPPLVFDDYSELRSFWMNRNGKNCISVEVIDQKQKGFK